MPRLTSKSTDPTNSQEEPEVEEANDDDEDDGVSPPIAPQPDHPQFLKPLPSPVTEPEPTFWQNIIILVADLAIALPSYPDSTVQGSQEVRGRREPPLQGVRGHHPELPRLQRRVHLQRRRTRVLPVQGMGKPAHPLHRVQERQEGPLRRGPRVQARVLRLPARRVHPRRRV